MPENNLVKLGNCMRQARKMRGFTQQELSEKSGVSARHIANIEKGLINPSFDVLSALVTTLAISFDTLFLPPTEKEAADIKEFAEFYKVCPDNSRHLIMAAIRALAKEIMLTTSKIEEK